MSTNPIPDVYPIHGRFGELYVGSQVVAEATGIEFTVEVEQVEINQVGARWTRQMPGRVTGTGTLNLLKVYSVWEDFVVNYASRSVQALRADRDAGVKAFPSFTMVVELNDPNALQSKAERTTLKGVQFFQMTGGFQVADVINRDMPFNFWGIERTQPITAPPGYTIPTYVPDV
jgi:hypothetical protein